MPWIELSLDTTGEGVDWVRTLLAGTAYSGVIQMTAYGGVQNEQSGAAIAPENWAFTLSLQLPTDQASLCAAIEQAIAPLVRTGIATPLRILSAAESIVGTAMPTANGHPLKQAIGQRFVVWATPAAADQTADQRADEIPLYIPPSLAFGSGLHPATQLSLQVLERHVRPAMSSLDLGCGSGILSVAMAKLGAQVVAIDNDAIAVQASQEAVQRNGVASQVTVMQASLGAGSALGHWMGGEVGESVQCLEPKAAFNLIAANILARVHIALAADLRQALQPQGLLLTAGFTVDYEADVLAALAAVGFETIDCERSQEWVALMHRLNV
jgi:ribosomal protein L11 methyltransferase